MGDFNIGLLSVLDIDTSSSKERINSAIEKNINGKLNSVKVDLDVNTQDALSKINSSLDKLSKDKGLKNITVGLDVDQSKSAKSIDSTIDNINRKPSKAIDVELQAKVNSKSISNATKNIKPQKIDLEVNTGLDLEKTANVKNLQNAYLDLARTYRDKSALETALSRNTDQRLTHEIKETRNANNELTQYIVNLKKIDDLNKTVFTKSLKYAVNPDQSLSLQKVQDANKSDEARRDSLLQINKLREQEIKNIEKLVANGKLVANEADGLIKKLNEVDLTEAKNNDFLNIYKAESLEVQKQVDGHKQKNIMLDKQARAIAQIESAERRMANSIDKHATKRIKQQIMALNNNGSSDFKRGAAAELVALQNQFRGIRAEAERATRSQLGFVESFRQAMVKFPVWMGATTLFFGAIQSGKMFIQTITDIDSKMVTLAKVMDSGTNLDTIFMKANDAALQFGQTIGDALDVYAEFARQGVPEKELPQFANAALIAANVGEIDAKQASEYLTSMSAQWDTSAKDAMRQVDSLNEISNKYATTVEKLAQGQAKAGSTAKSMGLTFDETNAVIGTLTAKTKQSGDEIGNFMKATLPKLYSDKGKSTLEGLGINLKDEQGNLKSAIALLEEASQKIKGMDKDQQSAVIRGLGGVYHYQRMQVLLEDLGKVDSMYKQIKDTSENSGGSALNENAKYMESVEAKINRAKVSIEQFAVALGDVFLKSGMLDGIRMFTDLMTGLTTSITKLGTAAPLVGVLGGALALFSKNVRTGFVDARISMNDFVTDMRKQVNAVNTMAKVNTGVGSIANSQILSMPSSSITSLKQAQIANNDLKNSMAGVVTQSQLTSTALQRTATTTVATATTSRVATTAVNGLKLAFRGLASATLVGAGLTAVSFFLEKVIGKMNEAKVATEQFEQQQQQTMQAFSSMGAGEVNKIIESYDKLNQKMQSGASFNTEEAAEYKNVTSQLANIFPDLVNGENEYGTAMSGNAETMRQRLADLKSQLELEKQVAQQKAIGESKEAVKTKDKQADSFKYSQTNTHLGDYVDKHSTPSDSVEIREINEKVKAINSEVEAKKGIKLINDQIRQAVKNGNDSEKARLEGLRSQVEKYAQAQTMSRSAIQESTRAAMTEYNALTAQMTNGNYKIGQSGIAVMNSLGSAVQNYAKNGQQALSMANNLNAVLVQDSGFVAKMKSYEQALKEFKNAKSESEKIGMLPTLEAAYRKVAEAVLEAAKNAGLSKSAMNQLKQSLESGIESEVGYEATVSKSGKVTIDATKAIEEKSKATADATAINNENADSTDNQSNANEELAKTMRNAAQSQELLGKALGEIQNGELSYQTLTDLVEKYGDAVLLRMNDEQALAEFLEQKRQEETNGITNHLRQRMDASEQYYQAVAGQGSELANHLRDTYGIDASNYSNLQQLKADVVDKWNHGTKTEQEKLIDGIAQAYGIDLSNFDTLSQKKQAVENALIKELGVRWEDYMSYLAESTNSFYSQLSGKDAQIVDAMKISGSIMPNAGAFAIQSDIMAMKLGFEDYAIKSFLDGDNVFKKATGNIGDIGSVADKVGSSLNGLGDSAKSAGSEAGKGLGKAAKAAKDTAKEAEKAGVSVEKLYKTFQLQTYVADKLALAMDKLNYQLEKQQIHTQKYATWSQKYRDSLKEENKLIDQKTKNLDKQIKSLEQQINSGKINEYGLVSSDLNVEYYQYKANGLKDGQSAKVNYTGVSGATNQQKTWSFLKSKGLTDAQVAGIMGNIEQESRFNASAEQMKGKFNGGKGLIQWDGARRNRLYDFAKSKGTAWTDVQTQLEFLWHELTTSEKAALNYLKRTTSAVQATQVFQQKFERAGIPNQGARNSAASKYYNQFKGKTNFGVPSGSAIAGTIGKGLIDSPNAKSNRDPWKTYASWTGMAGKAHYGKDISGIGIGGKNIRAAKAGVVTFAGWTGGGNTISIFDGQNTYTYMHMQKPTSLRKGQTVQAGQVVGKVGSTFGKGGYSSGNHLHVQVNKGKTASGTFVDSFTGKNAAIDPDKYGYMKVSGSSGTNFNIDTSAGSYYNGSADAEYVEQLNAQEQARLAEIEQVVKLNNEAEAMKQKVDEARKNLYSLQLDRIKNSNAKDENLFKIHKSSVEQYDHFKELQAAQTAKLQYELNKIEFEKGRNNNEWRKKNKSVQQSKEQEKAWEAQKVKYIKNALKNKKLFGKDTVYRDEFEKMSREAERNILDIEENKRQILAEIANSLVDEIIEDFDKMNQGFDKELSQLGRNNSKRDSEDNAQAKTMVKDIQAQAKVHENRSKQAQFTISQLKQQLKGSKKNAELQKKINDKINELSSVYEDALVSAHQAKVEAADLDIQRIANLNAKRLKEGQSQSVKADYEGSFISQEYQIDLYRKNQEEKLKGINDEKKALELNKSELEKQLELYKDMPSQARKIKDSIDEVTNSLKENSKNLHTIRAELANATIQSIKTIYQKQLEVATKAYDKEYSEYEKLINKKIKLIDEQAQEETYQKDMDKKNEEMNKLREEIAQRTGDDSLANQKKLKDLREQLKQQEEDYNTYLTNKAREDRKKALQEELNDKNEQINKQKEDLNTAYQDLLENTRLFNSIQEALMEGQMDKYKLMIEDLAKFVNDNMKDIGYSVSQNILDALNTTFNSLQQVAPQLTEAEKGTTPVPNSTLQPTVRPEAITSAIKSVNALTPNAVALATSKIMSATVPTNLNKPNVVTNNNTQAQALVNIENFNGTKQETDALVNNLKLAMDKQGINL